MEWTSQRYLNCFLLSKPIFPIHNLFVDAHFHAEAIIIDVCIGLYSMSIYIYIHIFQSLDAEILSFHVYGIEKQVFSSSIFWNPETQDAKKNTKNPMVLMLKIPMFFWPGGHQQGPWSTTKPLRSKWTACPSWPSPDSSHWDKKSLDSGNDGNIMGKLGGKMGGSQAKDQPISADFWSGRIFPQKLGFGWFHHLFTSWKNGGRWEKMWFSPKIRISRKTNVFSPAKRCGFRAQNRYFGLSASTGMPPKHWRYLCHGRGQATL